MTDTTYATTRKDGLMWAECWCMATTVLVTPADVRNGRTGSCGRDGCDSGCEPWSPSEWTTAWLAQHMARPRQGRR